MTSKSYIQRMVRHFQDINSLGNSTAPFSKLATALATNAAYNIVINPQKKDDPYINLSKEEIIDRISQFEHTRYSLNNFLQEAIALILVDEREENNTDFISNRLIRENESNESGKVNAPFHIEVPAIEKVLINSLVAAYTEQMSRAVDKPMARHDIEERVIDTIFHRVVYYTVQPPVGVDGKVVYHGDSSYRVLHKDGEIIEKLDLIVTGLVNFENTPESDVIDLLINIWTSIYTNQNVAQDLSSRFLRRAN